MTRKSAFILLVPCAALFLLSGLLAVILCFWYWTHPARDGAVAVTLRVAAESAEGGRSPDGERLGQVAADVERVLRQSGVRGPRASVADAEARRLRVELPGAGPEEVGALLQDRAELEFRLVERKLEPGEDPRGSAASAPGGMDVGCERQASAGAGEAAPCYLLHATPVIVGTDVWEAWPDRGQFGEPVVSLRFTDIAGERLGRLTADNVGKRLAIVLDGGVVSAPTIISRVSDRATIQGSFSKSDVQDMVQRLRAGMLPVLSVIRSEPISPRPWLLKLRLAFLVAVLLFVVSVGCGVFLIVRIVRRRPTEV